ncbi:carph-isopro domain-containing protein [Sphingobium sp. MI1205]|uniref:carph-isopro domain-containing protein n=1 Tax=Sphingobium sp. MI1205 TaxID=407020 RepID=UPI003FA6C4C9
MSHAEIIDRIGGIRKLAQLLGHARHTTVQGWRDRDAIPVKHWPDVMTAARSVEQPLEPEDFLPDEMRHSASDTAVDTEAEGSSSPGNEPPKSPPAEDEAA